MGGTTPCDTTTFGDPVTGTKGCWCTPTAATAKEDVKAADCTGGAAPTCVIMTATLSYTGLNYTDGLAVGANELTYRHIAAGGASQFSGKAGSKALTWSEKTLSMDIQIECANANDCDGKLTHATYTKTSEGYSIGMNKALKTWQAVAANKKEIGKLADYNPNWAFSIEKGNGVLAGAAATKKWTCGIPTTTTTVTTTTTTRQHGHGRSWRNHNASSTRYRESCEQCPNINIVFNFYLSPSSGIGEESHRVRPVTTNIVGV